MINDYIIEYLRNVEEEETDNVYLVKFTEVKTLYINGENSKSLARFINHSCNPNSNLVQLCVDDLPCMCFYIAIKDMKCKKEISFDYK
jgi:SET domain-containing protein